MKTINVELADDVFSRACRNTSKVVVRGNLYGKDRDYPITNISMEYNCNGEEVIVFHADLTYQTEEDVPAKTTLLG